MRQRHYIANPQIDVAVLEPRSRQIFVLGLVTRPGRCVLDGTTAKLTDVLAMAGGLLPVALNAALVAVLGLLFGVLVALSREARDARLPSAEDVALRLRQPLLLSLPDGARHQLATRTLVMN
jgi:polysaccharide export outer membrane protein